MNKPLYIVWNDNQMIHVPILDEQHHAVVAAINSLYFFINQGWGLSALNPTLKIIKATVGFHLKTEEGVLEKLGADYKVMLKHGELLASFNLRADAATKEAMDERDPMILLKFLRQWWLHHLNEDHHAYETYMKKIVVKAERD